MQLKKYTQKDRHGNMMSYEFEVPPMNEVPKPETSFPGGPKGTDTVPAWLTPGENVVNAEASRLYQPLLDQMNNVGRSIQAQQGGPIPDYLAGGAEVDGEVSYNPLAWITPEVLNNLKQTESGGTHLDPSGNLIQSPSGALGAYQWLPKSAAQPGFGVQPFDITNEEEQRKATRDYLAGIQSANPNFTPEQVLQSYNAGPTRMRNFVAGQGKPLTNETIQYPGKVLADVDRSQWGARAIPVVYNDNTSTTSNIMPELTDVSPGHAMFNNKIDRLTYDVPELDGTIPPPDPSVVQVPGFEGQDPSKMSPGRLAAYNKALAMMNNNGMPIETDVTKNRRNIDYGDPTLNVPELDGVAEDPSDGSTIDYTKDITNAEKLFPGFVEPTFPNRGRSGIPTPAQINERVAIEKYGADIKVDKNGRPEKVNSNRINPKVITDAAEANIDGKISDAQYEQIKKDFANANNQNNAANTYEVEKTEGKKVKTQEALNNTIAGLTNQLGADEVKNNIIMNKIEKINQNISEKEIVSNLTNKKDKAIVLKDEKANTLLQEIVTRTNAYNVSKTTTEESAEKALKLKKEKDKGKSLNQSKGFFAELFGDLIDTKELARMAVMYAGSRALGNSHEGSLGFAAVNYIKRIDTKAANREKTALTLIAKGKHTTASIAAYKKSGDENDLILVGAPINSTGKDKYLFHPILKKKVLVREFKQNDNVYWSADGGKSPVSGEWTSDGTAVRGSKDFRDYTSKAIPILDKILKDDKKQYDKDKVTSKDGIVTKTTYKTDINITQAAGESAKWAAENGLAVDEMGTIVSAAYRMAIEQSGGEDKRRPTSLIPYLNFMKIRKDTQVPDLFARKDSTAAKPVPMEVSQVNTLSTLYLAKMNRPNQTPSEGNNRDILNIFWQGAAKIWARKLEANPELLQQYKDKALKDQSPFYVFAKEELDKLN